MSLLLAFALIVAAAALDIAANVLLGASDGFRKKRPGLLALLLVGLAFFCLSLAVDVLPLTIAYASWGAIGILGTSLAGWFLFGQRLKPCAWAGMVLLLGGIIFLRLSA